MMNCPSKSPLNILLIWLFISILSYFLKIGTEYSALPLLLLLPSLPPPAAHRRCCPATPSTWALNTLTRGWWTR